jgi:hypothetical protein
VCLDAEGTLWVADDRGRNLLRFPGALAKLSGLVASAPPATAAR